MNEPVHRLRVLIANERDDRIKAITEIVEALGHDVVARELRIDDVGRLSRSTGADVALVGLGLDSEHALRQIDEIVREAACPVIAFLDAQDRSYIDQAAQRGVFAYFVLNGDDLAELQSALDITLRRFAEYHNLQGAFGRRAFIEQAKGILMGRNNISAEAAFRLLKEQSQRSGLKVSDVAEALTRTHQLLPAPETERD